MQTNHKSDINNNKLNAIINREKETKRWRERAFYAATYVYHAHEMNQTIYKHLSLGWRCMLLLLLFFFMELWVYAYAYITFSFRLAATSMKLTMHRMCHSTLNVNAQANRTDREREKWLACD